MSGYLAYMSEFRLYNHSRLLECLFKSTALHPGIYKVEQRVSEMASTNTFIVYFHL